MRASFFCHFHRKLAVYVLVFQLISGDSVSLPFYFFVILVFLWVRALCRFSRFRATRTTLRPPIRKTSLTQWLRSWVSCGIGWINTFLECSGLSAWEAGPFRFVGELGEPGGGGKGLAAVRQITSNIFEFFFCFFPWFMHFVHLVHLVNLKAEKITHWAKFAEWQPKHHHPALVQRWICWFFSHGAPRRSCATGAFFLKTLWMTAFLEKG